MSDKIRNLYRRAKIQAEDGIKNSRAAWELLSLRDAARALAARDPKQKLGLRAAAYRRTKSRLLQQQLESQLSPWLAAPKAAAWRTHKIGWERYGDQLAGPVLDKSIVLKTPSANREKGVLYVSFEYNALRLLAHHDLPKILQDYLLVVGSSWSPPDFASLWALAHVGPDPIFLQLSNRSDQGLHERLPDNIEPISLLASDWINPDFYRPKLHSQRDIDILMVAGWSRNKRHWLLFNALRQMRRSLRVILIGQNSEGRTADDVWREAKAFGVSDQIEIVQDATIETVTKYQCNSRVSVILSAREGSCVVVAESFFANSPVAMMHDAHVGSRAYMNPETGTLLRPRTMPILLAKLVEESHSYRPRAWAKANISCFQSSRKLNAHLRDYCVARGMEWTRDILPLCWRPDPVYAINSDVEQMHAAYRKLYEQHGVVIRGRTKISDSIGINAALSAEHQDECKRSESAELAGVTAVPVKHL